MKVTEGFINQLSDKDGIPMVVSHEMAICIASLMQLALRQPDIKTQTPDLYRIGRDFWDALTARIIEEEPQMAAMLLAGWGQENDVTAEQFEADFSTFFNPDRFN
jgi:hypothetical protein